LTRSEWIEWLTSVEYEDAIAAVVQFGETREEPPTPGMVARAAREIEQRRFEERRLRLRKLVVVPSAEERARCQAQLHELIEALGKKMVGANTQVTADEDNSCGSRRNRVARRGSGDKGVKSLRSADR
jgi:hypothetical protein